MAKEKEEPKPKHEGGKEHEGKKPKHHLHEIRSTQAHAGSIIHHHTYKEHADHPFSMPERGPMATSSSPEEAGQHVAEMFGQNQMGGPNASEQQGAAPAGAGSTAEESQGVAQGVAQGI